MANEYKKLDKAMKGLGYAIAKEFKLFNLVGWLSKKLKR